MYSEKSSVISHCPIKYVFFSFMSKLPEQLQKKIAVRIDNNSLRVLTYSKNNIDVSSNDYLGFSKNANIGSLASEIGAKTTFLNGSTGSRLVSGTHNLHLETEKIIAKFHHAETGLLYNSGYDANIGLFSSLLQRGDSVIYDELIHASIRDGIKLSHAKALKFKHNCLEDLQKKIKKSEGTTYIAIESVYSMDGDSAPLEAISNIATKHNCLLIVDEAHSSGVFGTEGRGMIHELNLENKIFARVHTFGKALGCHGAIVLGSKELRHYLINFSRSFIYTTAAATHSIATIQAAYHELTETKSIEKLKNNIQYFKEGISTRNLMTKFIPSDSAIHCCVFSGNDRVKQLASILQNEGFDIKPILSPTVPEGQERLRICIHSFNTKKEMDLLLNHLANF
jgi:8-amino-7-oxononanoate synthase